MTVLLVEIDIPCVTGDGRTVRSVWIEARIVQDTKPN